MQVRNIDSLDQFNFLKDKEELDGFFNVPDPVYFGCGLPGSTDNKLYDKSPAHYLAAQSEKRKDTPDLILGRALHKIILEGRAAFDKSYAVGIDVDRRTKAGKAQYAEWLGSIGDKEVLTQAQADTIESIMHWLGKQDNTYLLEGGLSEVAIFGQYEGEWFRGKLDKYNAELNYIADLKTTTYDTRHAFIGSVFRYGYHVQAAYYMLLTELATGIAPAAYYMVGLPKTPPHELMVFRLGESALQLGKEIALRCINLHVQCSNNKAWPFADADINLLEAPDWALREEGLID